MRYLWFYIVCWKHRNDNRVEMFEQYTLILKAARRCAYDLGHASSCIKGTGRSLFHDRHHMWLNIFSPTGGKDYRHELYFDIVRLENEVKRLEKVCTDNNINHTDPDSIPF